MVAKISKPLKIVSGGQTGVDRAALDWAIASGIEHGGYCPKGRIAEDGTLDLRYRLQEMNSANYSVRTRKNAEISDATLIFYYGELSGGTLNTQKFCEDLNRPYLLINLALQEKHAKVIIDWLVKEQIHVLNIAGPRASKCSDCYQSVYAILENLTDFLE